MEQAVSIHDKGLLLSLVERLSVHEVRAVTLFAECLLAQPLGDVGQSFIEMLLHEGADATAVLAAAQAVQDVDRRLAQETDPKSGLDNLYQRTEKHFQSWCRERGIDYDTLSEDEFTELVERAINQVREQ